MTLQLKSIIIITFNSIKHFLRVFGASFQIEEDMLRIDLLVFYVVLVKILIIL